MHSSCGVQAAAAHTSPLQPLICRRLSHQTAWAHLVGSSNMMMAGLISSSEPTETRLRSPPDTPRMNGPPACAGGQVGSTIVALGPPKLARRRTYDGVPAAADAQCLDDNLNALTLQLPAAAGAVGLSALAVTQIRATAMMP